MKNKIAFFLLMLSFLSTVEAKFVLLLGPSGVGKSTIIGHLKEMDNRFIYVTPLTTRERRAFEIDKISVSREEIAELNAQGKLLTINEIYGNLYATPKYLIDDALAEGQIPVLDWPIQKMSIMQEHYSEQLFIVYLLPENIDAWRAQLEKDGRDPTGERFEQGLDEITSVQQGRTKVPFDLLIVNRQGQADICAREIYNALCLQ